MICVSSQDVLVSPRELSLKQLEQRRDDIDLEISQLARFSLRGEVGSNGYRSRWFDHADKPQWVQVDLGQEVSIDEIILAPTLSRTQNGIRCDGFPIRFQVLVGSAENDEGTVIASFSEDDQILPRIAPLIIPCSGITGSWVRIEASQLSSRDFDGRFVLQFSELFVFSGAENCALRRPVTAPDNFNYLIDSWGERFLTDGSVPYLMDAATGERSLAYLSWIDMVDAPSLTVDLERPCKFDTITLHAVDQSDTIPQSGPGDVGIPRLFRVEGALKEDFSDASVLLEGRQKSIYDISPMMSWNISPEKAYQFVRLTAVESYIFDNGSVRRKQIGFAEIELFNDDINLALGKAISCNFINETNGNRPLNTLNDGQNFYGSILPVREWMHQLARRHDLEKERPIIASELQNRYTLQERNLRRMYWLAAALAVGILITFLTDRIIRMRHVAWIRSRFAADLHDEVGADLHTIGLLSDLATDAKDSPKKLTKLLRQIRSTTEETGAAVRHCSNLQETILIGTELSTELRRAAQRILVKVEHELSIEGDYYLSRLRPRIQSDLYLFYKECLINVGRHANATRLETCLVATSREVHLTVSDNGVGVGKVPASLKRRARLLRAVVVVGQPEGGGTKITLKFSNKPWLMRRIPVVKAISTNSQ